MARKERTDFDLVVTQIRSGIGSKPEHRGTLRALGLRRIGAQNLLPDRPEIRGMLHHVAHLVKVEAASPKKTARKSSPKATTKEVES